VTGSPDDDTTARILDARSGKELTALKGHAEQIWWAEFSADGRQVVTGSADGTARLWNATSGKELARLDCKSPVKPATFSADGGRVMTRSRGTVRVWDARSGKELVVLTRAESGAVFSSDGGRVVTADDDTARVWDATTGKVLAQLVGHTGRVACVAFSTDGERVATGAADDTARVWNARSGEQLARLKGHATAWAM
jgi:WD40 repeat protein